MGLLAGKSNPSRNLLLDVLMDRDSGMNELRTAYAKAMWAWASVEAEWFTVYVAALDAFRSRFRSLQRSYFSIVSAKTRLDMTNVAAKTAWDKTPILDAWMTLAERSRKELSTRGRIAHLQGMVVYPEDAHEKKLALLMEHMWHPEHPFKYKERKNKGYSAEQLTVMQVLWEQLAKDLSDFSKPMWDEALKPAMPPPASVALVGGPSPATEPPLPQRPRKQKRQPQPSQE